MRFIIFAALLACSTSAFASQISSLNGLKGNAKDSMLVVHANVRVLWRNDFVDEEYEYAAREAAVVAIKQFTVKEITSAFALDRVKEEIKTQINESTATGGNKVADVFVLDLYVQPVAGTTSSARGDALERALLKVLRNN